MSLAHQRAAVANRKLSERGNLHQHSQHHIVSATVHDRASAVRMAADHGARLATGTEKHFVAHFDDKAKSHAFHAALKAAGHHDAKHGTVRESCPHG